MLLLSIHPEYVAKIFCGEKQVELRRMRPRCRAGDWIAIYATVPKKCLFGIAQVTEVKIDKVAELWERIQVTSGVTWSQYQKYYDGTDTAIGIMLANPICLATPIPLSELRSVWPNFHPPQGFRYLSAEAQEFVYSRLKPPSRSKAVA